MFALMEFLLLALEQELLLRPIGTTVYWMPPYVLEEEEGDAFAEAELAMVKTLR